MNDKTDTYKEWIDQLSNDDSYYEAIEESIENKCFLPENKSIEGRNQTSKEVKEQIENKGKSDFYNHRRTWSYFIIGWITILIIFNIVLTIFVGIGQFDFKSYQWFVTTVTAETFLQIVGLGYVAARYLFSDK